MEDNLWCKRTFNGRKPLMEDNLCGKWILVEDDLWRKMTFDGRQLFMEDNLRWKMTFDGRQPLMDDNLWWKTAFMKANIFFYGKRPLWKTTFGWRWSLMEGPLWWKWTFNGRQPLTEENVKWKKAFGRQYSMEDNLWGKYFNPNPNMIELTLSK